MSGIKDFINSLSETHFGVNILLTTIIIVVFFILTLFTRLIVVKNIRSIDLRYKIKKVLFYVYWLSALVLIGRVWIDGFSSITTILGLFSAGVAIALKDIIANIAAWVFISLKAPFKPGDRIQIGAFCGDVIDISVFQFTILEIGNWVDGDQSTGETVIENILSAFSKRKDISFAYPTVRYYYNKSEGKNSQSFRMPV